MTVSADARSDLGRPLDGLAAVDERQLVLVQRVQHELHADEGEDERRCRTCR